MAESLNCNFYVYTGDPRRADKGLANQTAVHSCSSIAPLEALSDTQIKLIIDYPVQSGNTRPAVMGCNYVAIDDLWYKITNKERLTGGALAIYGEIDGIYSYLSGVLASPAVVRRSSGSVDSYIHDHLYTPYPDSFNAYAPFSGSFSGDSQIVLTYVK